MYAQLVYVKWLFMGLCGLACVYCPLAEGKVPPHCLLATPLCIETRQFVYMYMYMYDSVCMYM